MHRKTATLATGRNPHIPHESLITSTLASSVTAIIVIVPIAAGGVVFRIEG